MYNRQVRRERSSIMTRMSTQAVALDLPAHLRLVGSRCRRRRRSRCPAGRSAPPGRRRPASSGAGRGVRAVVVHAHEVDGPGSPADRPRTPEPVAHPGVHQDVGRVLARASNGSRNSRFRCRRRAARPRDPRRVRRGMDRVGFSVMPRTESLPAQRMASSARPCPSSRWCTAFNASAPPVRPGRVHAVAVAEEGRAPRLVQRHPVLDHVASASWVTPRSRGTRSAVSRTSQPPASSSGCGRSQWYSVAYGVTPFSRQVSAIRR